jgi:hypothetical protein
VKSVVQFPERVSVGYSRLPAGEPVQSALGNLVEANLYAPPAAVVADVPDVVEVKPFYVVGKMKFLVLFFLSLGFFQFVMYYLHWARFKRATKMRMWPIARAIFAVFFIHSLTEEVDHKLQRGDIRHPWSPRRSATVVVVLLLLDRVLGRVPEDVMSENAAVSLSIAMLLPLGWFLWQIQGAANAASGDPEGESNRQLTWINWLWIVLLALGWVLVGVGLSLPDQA